MANTKNTEIPTIQIVDAQTGESFERPLTATELKELQEMQAQNLAYQAEVEAKVAARASALAKLAELGLTDKEIAAL